MKRDLVNKKVMQAQSNRHSKAKQVQFQDFQHKERKLSIIEMHKTMFPSLIIIFSSFMNKLNNITITKSMPFMIFKHIIFIKLKNSRIKTIKPTFSNFITR